MVCNSKVIANPLAEPLSNSRNVVKSKVFRPIASVSSATSSDDDDDEGFSSEDSSKSAILTRFLNKLMEPMHPLKYSKSLPSLVAPNQTDNVRFRSEALVTEGWILERCIEGTPGRKYNVSGLIVDSDTILATQLKSGRFGFAGGDCFADHGEVDDCDDSASQDTSNQIIRSSVYFYVIMCILILHLVWCVYKYCGRCFESHF